MVQKNTGNYNEIKPIQFELPAIGGLKFGRKLGFRTANFDVSQAPIHLKPGVFAAKVIYQNQIYAGALYFGPNFQTGQLVLEVHLINFTWEIYGEKLQVKVGRWLRSPRQFRNVAEAKQAITADVEAVKHWWLKSKVV